MMESQHNKTGRVAAGYFPDGKIKAMATHNEHEKKRAMGSC